MIVGWFVYGNVIYFTTLEDCKKEHLEEWAIDYFMALILLISYLLIFIFILILIIASFIRICYIRDNHDLMQEMYNDNPPYNFRRMESQNSHNSKKRRLTRLMEKQAHMFFSDLEF